MKTRLFSFVTKQKLLLVTNENNLVFIYVKYIYIYIFLYNDFYFISIMV